MSVEIEYELTYLARSIPEDAKIVTAKIVEDIYFPANLEIHPHLRLRRSGESYSITKKIPLVDGDFSTQTETTIDLDKQEYIELKKAGLRKVTKHRYVVELAGRTAEVDVFKEDLEGLVLIDFEFESSEAKEKFIPPNVCLRDVTQEEFIAGGYLAGRAYQDIEESLTKLGYTKVH